MPSPLPKPHLRRQQDADRERIIEYGEYIQRMTAGDHYRQDADYHELETACAEMLCQIKRFRKNHPVVELAPRSVTVERMTVEGADLSSLSNWNVRERAI